MTKYKYGNPEAPIVLIQPVGDHDLPEIEGEVAQSGTDSIGFSNDCGESG